MFPVDFPGSNMVLKKPDSMTDEQCFSLCAHRGVDEHGFPFFLICVQPNKEDIEAISAGRPIYVKVVGDSFPPMALFTLDENNKAN